MMAVRIRTVLGCIMLALLIGMIATILRASSNTRRSITATETEVSIPKERMLYDPFYYQSISQAAIKPAAHQACVLPVLNPWDKQVLPFVKDLTAVKSLKPLRCDIPPPLTYVWNRTHVRINESVVQHFGNPDIASQCKIGFFNRYWDTDEKWSEFFELKVGRGFRLPNLEQYILVMCGQKSTKSSLWEYTHTHLRLTAAPEIKKKVKAQTRRSRRRLSVLLFIVDGVSHLMSRRSLNTTYYYLLNGQKAVPLNGYHSVGISASHNSLPYLTGHDGTELESQYSADASDWPYIWKNFSHHDYITSYAEDSRDSAISNQPIDYYMKSYINVIESMGSCQSTGVPVHQNMLRSLDSFLELHQSNDYFTLWLSNHKAIGHQQLQRLAQADKDYHRFFRKHFNAGTFENTLVVFGSFHSASYDNIKDTPLGKKEQQLPLHMLVFPEWFKSKHKSLFTTLQRNAARSLLTPFDLYATLLDIITIDKKLLQRRLRHQSQPGKSMFRRIFKRTCKEAGIAFKSCVCHKVKT